MANCDNYVFWSPVPAGATFNIKAAGDQHVFNVVVGRASNGAQVAPWLHPQVDPGPATQRIKAKDKWTFSPVVALFAKPNNPVTLEAWMSDAKGQDVTIPGNGASVTLRCLWQFDDKGAFDIDIDVA